MTMRMASVNSARKPRSPASRILGGVRPISETSGRIWWAWFITWLVAVTILTGQAQAGGGQWGVSAIPLGDGEVWSPDHKTVLRETGDGLSVVGKRIDLLSDVLSPKWLTEVLWAPNSRAFVISGSDGGIVGEWKTHLYMLDTESKPVAHDVAGLIAPLVKEFPQCGEEASYVNLAAIAWMNGSDDLAVVAEVPPHGTCRNMGALRGFLISTRTWKVSAQLTEAELRDAWKSVLGERLSGVDSARPGKRFKRPQANRVPQP
jgi:hypothetical protein